MIDATPVIIGISSLSYPLTYQDLALALVGWAVIQGFSKYSSQPKEEEDA